MAIIDINKFLKKTTTAGGGVDINKFIPAGRQIATATKAEESVKPLKNIDTALNQQLLKSGFTQKEINEDYKANKEGWLQTLTKLPIRTSANIIKGLTSMFTEPSESVKEVEKIWGLTPSEDMSTAAKVVTAPTRTLFKSFTRFFGAMEEPYAKDIGEIIAVRQLSDEVAKGNIPSEALDDIEVLHKTIPQITADAAQAVLAARVPALAKNISKGKIISGTIKGGEAGATFGVAQAVSSGSKDPNQIAEIIATNALAGMALGTITPAISKKLTDIKTKLDTVRQGVKTPEVKNVLDRVEENVAKKVAKESKTMPPEIKKKLTADEFVRQKELERKASQVEGKIIQLTDRKEYVEMPKDMTLEQKARLYDEVKNVSAKDELVHISRKTDALEDKLISFEEALVKSKDFADTMKKIDYKISEPVAKPEVKVPVVEKVKQVVKEKLDTDVQIVETNKLKPKITEDWTKLSSKLKILREEIKKTGSIDQPLIVNKVTNKVEDGMHRLLIAKELGIKEVPIIYINDGKLSLADLSKTKSQLTEIWNQTKKEVAKSTVKSEVKPEPKKVVKVPETQLPVGTGKEKLSRLEARIADQLNKAPEEVKGLSTYRESINKEQIKRAVEFVRKHPDQIMPILEGKQDPPKGLLKNSIYVAAVNDNIGNAKLSTQLASLAATRLGQEISILSEISKDATARYMTAKINSTIEALGGREKLAAKRQVSKKELVESVKKNNLTRDDWGKFVEEIDKITC